jgi:hypothetical protein
MPRSRFTIEIHPRAWYALANLPQETYERIKRGLAGVAESLNGVQVPQALSTSGGWLSLDGYLAHYTVQPERRCVVVMDIERSAPGRQPPASAPAPGGANVLLGTAAPAAERAPAPNVLVGAGNAAAGAPSGPGAPSTLPVAPSAHSRPEPGDA